jgi:D-alanyl-lipoteichoic acid acyltransferase DltB (MBOAT superfamily)
MFFNSIDFAIFLPIVFVLYWFVTKNNLKFQNLLIVLMSYVFYGWWDWRFLSLIIFSTVIDYLVGRRLKTEEKHFKRKILLWTSIIINLGFLGFFKYYNFFLDNFQSAFSFLGYGISSSSLNIVLPIGISFYTFQTLSYSIDVYRRKLEPTKDFIAFSAFVCFFPQLVAGPIEKASNLLPQFYKRRKFNYTLAVDGVKQMVWGFFMKIVIADNCAAYANQIFDDYESYNAASLFIGALMFTFQIYGDFAGYSNIAIGVSRLFGFNLKQNFAFPYFSRDIAEFWRRWHISLSTWFRDYLYIPLGGSRVSNAKKIRNTFIIFVVSGFWHGANWTFAIWGLLNAIYFLPLLLLKKNRVHLGVIGDSRFPRLNEILGMVTTFLLTILAWVFFRSENITEAFGFLGNIVTLHSGKSINVSMVVILVIIAFVLIEWFGRRSKFAIQNSFKNYPIIDRVFTYIIIISIFMFGQFNSEYEFIYFQF